MDRHVARPALHDRRPRRHARERPDRPVLRRQLGHVATSRCPTPTRSLRLWRNTAAASLTSGQSLHARRRNTLGYEWDEDADNGFRPAGQFELSSTTVSGLEVFTDYGSTTKLNGTARTT